MSHKTFSRTSSFLRREKIEIFLSHFFNSGSFLFFSFFKNKLFCWIIFCFLNAIRWFFKRLASKPEFWNNFFFFLNLKMRIFAKKNYANLSPYPSFYTGRHMLLRKWNAIFSTLRFDNRLGMNLDLISGVYSANDVIKIT